MKKSKFLMKQKLLFTDVFGIKEEKEEDDKKDSSNQSKIIEKKNEIDNITNKTYNDTESSDFFDKLKEEFLKDNINSDINKEIKFTKSIERIITLVDKAISNNSEYADAYFYRAAIKKELGDKNGFRSDYAMAINYYLNEDDNWAIDMDSVEKSYKEAVSKGIIVKAFVVINPGNPTGQVMTLENMQKIIEFCYKHNLVLMADEINCYDITNADVLVVEEDAVKKIEEVLK